MSRFCIPRRGLWLVWPRCGKLLYLRDGILFRVGGMKRARQRLFHGGSRNSKQPGNWPHAEMRRAGSSRLEVLCESSAQDFVSGSCLAWCEQVTLFNNTATVGEAGRQRRAPGGGGREGLSFSQVARAICRWSINTFESGLKTRGIETQRLCLCGDATADGRMLRRVATFFI